MSEVIVFTSGKGGVGKSNLCLNTALELTARQHRTCLFDGDLGLANVNILLGIDQEYSLDDVVFNQKSLDDILVESGYGFDIIPGSSGAEQIANLDDGQLDSLITALSGVGEYDYFLIDTASGISKSVMSFCMAARQTIIVITHEATSLTDAYALLKILSINGYQGAVRILINNCDSVAQAKKTYLRYRKVVDKHLDIAITPAGIILHDDHFERAVVRQKPLLELFPDSIAAQCIKAFVANLTRNEAVSSNEPLADFWRRYLEQIKQDNASPKLGTGGDQRTDYPDPAKAGRFDPATRAADPYVLAQSLSPDVRGLFRSVHPVAGFCSAPAFLAVIFRRLNYGEITDSELTELLTVDPALAGQALRLAAAREHAVATNHIHRLDQLTAGLDDQDIRALLIHGAMAGTIKAADTQEEERLRELWLKSYSAALFARELADAASFAYPEEAYLCGLFLWLDRFSAAGGKHGDTEQDGGDAADILHTLGLNPMMCDAVRFSGYPAEQVKTAFDLVRIVHVARILATEDLSPDDKIFDEMLSLSAEQAGEACANARTHITGTVESLGIQNSSENNGGSRGKNSGLSGYLLDNLLTTTLMAEGGRQTDLQGWARRLQRNCSLLFNIERIISFVGDDEERYLAAIDYPGCFYSDSLANFIVPIESSSSLLSRAYRSGSLVIEDLSDGSGQANLGDRQLGRLLGDTVLICIPLKYESITRGIIVCATGNTDFASITAMHSRLSSLVSRAAQELTALGGPRERTVDSGGELYSGKLQN